MGEAGESAGTVLPGEGLPTTRSCGEGAPVPWYPTLTPKQGSGTLASRGGLSPPWSRLSCDTVPPPSAQCPPARRRTWRYRQPRPPSWMSLGNRHRPRARTGTSRATRYHVQGGWHRAGAQRHWVHWEGAGFLAEEGHGVPWEDAGRLWGVLSSPGRRCVVGSGEMSGVGEMLGALGDAMHAVGEGIPGKMLGIPGKMLGVPGRCWVSHPGVERPRGGRWRRRSSDPAGIQAGWSRDAQPHASRHLLGHIHGGSSCSEPSFEN